MKIVAVVPAAGQGKRLKKEKFEKPFIRLRGKPLLIYALSVLNSSLLIDEIILLVSKKFIDRASALIRKYKLNKVKHVKAGGSTRSDSVSNGLNLISDDVDYVLIHDGVRPFLERILIERSVKAAKKFGASCVCVPVKPTIKTGRNGFITKTLIRNELWDAQTPQTFRRDIILKAYKRRNLLKGATDDSSLVEKLGYKVRIVMGTYRNIKITTEEDLLLAEALLKIKIPSPQRGEEIGGV